MYNYEFTREQIKGTLENYKLDKEKTIEQLTFKRSKYFEQNLDPSLF